MNRIRQTTTIALLGLMASATAFAQYTGPGAQPKPENMPPARTVAEVLKDPVDDRPVELTGKILRQTGKETFTFADATGEITVEIDDDDFPAGQPVAADAQVLIQGEIDGKWMRKPRIDVERLRLVTTP